MYGEMEGKVEKMKDARAVKRRTERKGEEVMHGEEKGTGESPEGDDETSKTPHFQIFMYINLKPKNTTILWH